MNTSALMIAGLLLTGVVYIAYDETVTPSQQTNQCIDHSAVSLDTTDPYSDATSSDPDSLPDCSTISEEAVLSEPDANPTRVESSHPRSPKTVARSSPRSFMGSDVNNASRALPGSPAADDAPTATTTQRNCLFDNCN